MTKSLKTLIKLASKQVEKEQEVLANLQGRWDKFDGQRTELLDNLANEAKVAEINPEFAANFGEFARVTQAKVRNFEAEMNKLLIRIEVQRERLRGAFAEQKKYEIALENKEAEIFVAAKKSEQKMLDEVAVQGHRRENEF